jgi:hypothetical protein
VSHDSGFLDTVCTGIIHYENKKLVKYKGNLSAFVAQRPEAKAYYELTDEFVKFTFPVPGPLDGVKCAPPPCMHAQHACAACALVVGAAQRRRVRRRCCVHAQHAC